MPLASGSSQDAAGKFGPAYEWTLGLFATFLATRIQHSTIKVYLSGVKALHIEQGFLDTLANCLHVQRVVSSALRAPPLRPACLLPMT